MSRSFTIHDLPKEERPRERLVKFGEQALSAQELLQLILGRGVAGGKILGIEVVDHVIVAKDKFLSMKEKGMLN